MNIGKDLNDFGWIVQLLKEQEPDRDEILIALKQCKNGTWERKSYVRFVDRTTPNQPWSEWQFKENIVLEHPTEGTIVIDCLKDGRIGGIEFVSRIEI